MKTKSALSVIAGLTVLLLTVPGHAEDAPWDFSPYRAQIADPGFAPQQAPADETVATVPSGKKNVGRGIMFSLVIPGAGQLYAGSWLRALPWFAVEVAGWVLFSGYQADGDDKTSEYEAFAGAREDPNHFDVNAYFSREFQVVINPTTVEGGTPYGGTFDEWMSEDWDVRAEYLPPPYGHDVATDDIQQYYEMIGKYFTQFGYGWDDTYEHSGPFTGDPGDIWSAVSGDDPATLEFDGDSPNFFRYRDMRGEANDIYDKANLMMELVMVNHILSALDAAFAIRSYNRKLDESPLGHMKLRYEHENFDGRLARMLTLSIPLDQR